MQNISIQHHYFAAIICLARHIHRTTLCGGVFCSYGVVQALNEQVVCLVVLLRDLAADLADLRLRFRIADLLQPCVELCLDSAQEIHDEICRLAVGSVQLFRLIVQVDVRQERFAQAGDDFLIRLVGVQLSMRKRFLARQITDRLALGGVLFDKEISQFIERLRMAGTHPVYQLVRYGEHNQALPIGSRVDVNVNLAILVESVRTLQ